jgi:hypothetical protein
LLHASNGPAGWCITDDLVQIDHQECSPESIEPLLNVLEHRQRPLLAAAIREMVAEEPGTLECRPIRGGARLTEWANFSGPYPLARFLGDCGHPADDARLFHYKGEIIQACMKYEPVDPVCMGCKMQQDGGPNCDFETMVEHDCLDQDRLEFNWFGLQDFQRPVPQVSCQATPAGQLSGLRCVPRFNPGPSVTGIAGESNAMCVPMGRADWDADCGACYRMTRLPFVSAPDPDAEACLAAPPHCRVRTGEVDPLSCDATNLADVIFERQARMPVPLRCGLRLPLARLVTEPDRLGLILAEAYPCPNGATPPCTIQDVPSDLGAQRAKALFWQELVGLAGAPGIELDLNTPGLEAPQCFPRRDEWAEPLGPLAAGPMPILGQLVRSGGVHTVINSPLCGWRSPETAGVLVGP